MKKRLFSAWAVRCKDGKTHAKIAPTKSDAKRFATYLDDNKGRCSQEADKCGPHKLVKLVEVAK